MLALKSGSLNFMMWVCIQVDYQDTAEILLTINLHEHQITSKIVTEPLFYTVQFNSSMALSSDH